MYPIFVNNKVETLREFCSTGFPPWVYSNLGKPVVGNIVEFDESPVAAVSPIKSELL
jgi:hypothetical protein